MAAAKLRGLLQGVAQAVPVLRVVRMARQQGPETGLRLGELAAVAQRVAEVGPCRKRIRFPGQHGAVLHDGARQVAELLQHHAEVVARAGHSRIEAHRLFQRGARLGQALGRPQGVAQLQVRLCRQGP
jgi:hypothetical protein